MNEGVPLSQDGRINGLVNVERGASCNGAHYEGQGDNQVRFVPFRKIR
jgi:hypothetical protein